MQREHFTFDKHRTGLRYSRGFILLFLVALLPSAGIWFFYRSLFPIDSSLVGTVILTIVTALSWAYLIGYADDRHTAG
ncbi:hypothetical protein ACN08X_02055 [Rothia sp. P6271]|uniref:hypothetical protein n=1 Tax=unclassified Rothia (in: high G+C Gram-positive bacteria) TaxID=2689056 RepID=UPI003AC346DC